MVYNLTPYFNEIKERVEALIIFELYQHLNLNNLKTIHLLFQELEKIDKDIPNISGNIDLIYTFKLCNQISLLSALYYNNSEIQKILEFIQFSGYSSMMPIDKILLNILYLPKIDNLFNRFTQITIWETNNSSIVRKMVECKKFLFESFIKYFKQLPNQYPIICQKYFKIFEVKKHILEYVEESKVLIVYEKIATLVSSIFIKNLLV